MQYVKGIGPARADMLAAKALHTVSDLLYYAPFRYEDRRNIKPISQLAPGEKAVVLAQVASAKLTAFRGRGPALFEAMLRDGSTASLAARWFHGERFAESLVSGTRVALFGKVELERGHGSRLMIQPEIEILHEGDPDEMLHTGRIVAVYEAAGKITARVFRTLIDRILKEAPMPEDALPESVRKRVGLPDLATAIRETHVPPQDADLRLLNEFRTPAQVRLIFDEFFWLECGMALKKTRSKAETGIAFAVTECAREQMKAMLPFRPTAAQRRVMQEIADDMKRPHPMNRLLQGDVGSGKTIVAAQAAVIAIENGYQVAVLAPTEILANQHYWYFQRLFGKLGYVVVLLTGSNTEREKQQIKKLIAAGLVKVAVGTHALIQEDVSFEKLGLAIIDEQHRFGVRQRLELMKKGERPDVLVMTATPIPRTLALTIYGDLDVSTIDELPPGRKAIVTKHVPESSVEGAYGFLKQQIQAGRQAYVVYPVVEESETAAVKAAEKMFAYLSKEVFAGVEVGLLHGRMPAEQKERAMQKFHSGTTKILVATTVIEVGVDVPNASVIVIEQAERFGLSQIHQLRGRVGRGPHQSYCLLVTGKLNDAARERIRTLIESNDGFYIAEMDMKLRGPGEFFGTRQSGIPGLRLADLIRDADVLESARKEAQAFVAGAAIADELRGAARYIQENWQRRYGLVQVG
ncbi:MAG: ATP-dependent DNA helicase RecG [Acidobacteriaceae bacterium]|nr:ATP-dependent DNA helicase RecG [Acidobacteriaceae bacterium]